MTYTLPTAFFAYPSAPPMLPETLREAIESINASKQVHVESWESMKVGGKLIIGEICKKIENADLVLADITGLNPNVLFEIGYAIAKNKRVFLTLDSSAAGPGPKELGTLSTIGYAGYVNSEQLTKSFLRERPFEDLNETILENTIKPGLRPGGSPTLYYLKPRYETNASVRVADRVAKAPLRLIQEDPSESPYQPLEWYAQRIYAAEAVVVHLTGRSRQDALVLNAKYSLVAGIAAGMGKSVLLLSEGDKDYLAPLDYRELLRQYTTAAAASRIIDDWLKQKEEGWRLATAPPRDGIVANLRLATELKGLDLGEYIAENEGDGLVDGYFLETAAYREARSGDQTIFVGRKGTGKSANFLQLSSDFDAEPRCVLAVIKPVAYELESLLRLLVALTDRDKKVYLLQGLWKFLLYSDVARALAERIDAMVVQARTAEENAFLQVYEEQSDLLSGDFSSRIEGCVDAIEQDIGPLASAQRTNEYREGVSQHLHSSLIRSLREGIAKVAPKNGRIAIVIDNLDKAWDRENDLRSVAEFLLGLLGAATKIRHELQGKRKDLTVTLAIFLRADIFERVQDVAREPDKINYQRLSWRDSELFVELLQQRFIASQSEDISPEVIWERYFCPTVSGIETKRFLVEAVLPRPRDFLYLVKASVATAVNRGHARVEESDIEEACKQYSEFAIGILKIEGNSQDLSAIEDVVYEFAGADEVLSYAEVDERLAEAGVQNSDCERVIRQLCTLSFLGIEVSKDDFRFPDSSAEMQKTGALARRYCNKLGTPRRFKVHPAFHPFLEIGVWGPG